MAVQMAEYVTLAVLQAYRESRAYDAQQRERRWLQRERLDKPAAPAPDAAKPAEPKKN